MASLSSKQSRMKTFKGTQTTEGAEIVPEEATESIGFSNFSMKFNDPEYGQSPKSNKTTKYYML